MNHQRKRESERVGVNVPEPAWGEADCENESVGGDFGQQGVLLLLADNPGRWKFGEWRQTIQKKILATRCHQEPMGLKNLSHLPLKSPIALRYSHCRQ